MSLRLVAESPPTVEHFKAMIKKEPYFFGSEGMSLKKSLEILHRNPYMYCVLLENSKSVGLTSVYTPNNKGARLILGRKRIEGGSDGSYYMTPKQMRKTRLIYFASIYASGRGERRKNRAAALMYARASMVEQRIGLPKPAYAIGVSEIGVRLIKSYGGKQIGFASAEKEMDPFFKLTVTKKWCARVKARASKRVVPDLRFGPID